MNVPMALNMKGRMQLYQQQTPKSVTVCKIPPPEKVRLIYSGR